MKKLLLLFFVVVIAVSCSKGVKISAKGNSMSRAQAEKLMNESLKDAIVKEKLDYSNFIVSDNGVAYAFLWDKKGTNKKFLRFWEIYGDNPQVSVINNKKYFTVKVKSDSIDNNCYGYVFDEPEVSDNGVKTVWDDFSKFGCSHNLELKFKNKKAATNFANALIAIRNNTVDLGNFNISKPLEENTQKGINKSNCSVDKILKMKEIGLTKEEIKKICE